MPADLNDYYKKNSKPKPDDNNGSSNNNNSMNFENPFGGNKAISVMIIVGAFFILFLLLRPFTVINSGEVGIKVVMGKFENRPLNPGLHFFIPFVEQIVPVNTRVRLITYSNSNQSSIGDGFSSFEGGLKRNPAIRVLDKGGLTVNIDLAVQYRLRPESAPHTIEKWGTSWEEKIINSKVQEVVRDVIGRYSAEKLPEMRNEIAKAIETKIKQAIDSLPGKPVILTSVELRNIDLPKKIKEQIERVQIAKQQVTIAEQMKEKAKQEALRKAEIAKGEAQKKRIEAQGEADKITIEANAQAKANRVIAQSLSEDLLRLEQIKTQRGFNEALKSNKNAQIFLTPGGAVPNIWIDTKESKKAVSVGDTK